MAENRNNNIGRGRSSYSTPLILIIVLLSTGFMSIQSEGNPKIEIHDKNNRPGRRSKRALDDPYWKKFYDVSIVYTWVNGSNPEFQHQREQNGMKGSDSRYRDTDELLHSFRSLEKFIPWHTGTVFLVTPGDTPYWINTSHPRLRIINQNTLIPVDAQPTFNSAVIEMHLNLIPGLSELFIHMNDDYFIGKKIHPSDFFTDDGGIRLYHEANMITGSLVEHDKLHKEKTALWKASVFGTVALLDKHFGPLKEGRYFVKHAPFVYSKTVLSKVMQVWSETFKNTKLHKFRNYDDILIPFAHHGFVQQSKLIPFSNHIGNKDQDSALCILEDEMEAAHQAMSRQLFYPHMFFTINDGFHDPAPAVMLKSFLHTAYPTRSQFESLAVPENTNVVGWSSQYLEMNRRCNIKVKLPPSYKLHFDDPSIQLSCGPANCSLSGTCTQSGCVCNEGKIGTYCEYDSKVGVKSWKLIPQCESFDVIFTWVNGSDPELLKQMRSHTRTKEDKNPKRIRDTNQLRYGLRSIDRYMPWVRHIWVVSGTPCPNWLDQSHPKVSYVSHKDIFSESELPQLNSNSIQGRLWAIPNLANRWASMDDDFIITIPSPPQTFLGDDLTSTSQLWIKHFNAKSHIKGVYLDSLLRTRNMVKSSLKFDRTFWWSQAHSPPVCDKYLYSEVRRELSDGFESLAKSKMRSSRDLEPNFAHAYYLQGWQLAKRGDFSSISNEKSEDLICRIAGKHPSKWGQHHRYIAEAMLTPSCVDSAISGSNVNERCRERLIHAVTLTSTKYSHISKSMFKMLKNNMDFEKLKQKLESGSMRVACLNDDFVDVNPSFLNRRQVSIDKALSKLDKLMESMQPRAGPWELW